jgi:hypothetical protein
VGTTKLSGGGKDEAVRNACFSAIHSSAWFSDFAD